MSAPNPIIQQLNVLSQKLSNINSGTIIQKNKAFLENIRSKLSSILDKIKQLNGLAVSKNTQVQQMSQQMNDQLTQMKTELNKCIQANAGQNQAVTEALTRLGTTIDNEVKQFQSLNTTSQETNGLFDQLVSQINSEITNLNNAITSTSTTKGGKAKKARKKSRRNKKGGWVIDASASKSSNGSNRYKKSKKRRSYSYSS